MLLLWMVYSTQWDVRKKKASDLKIALTFDVLEFNSRWSFHSGIVSLRKYRWMRKCLAGKRNVCEREREWVWNRFQNVTRWISVHSRRKREGKKLCQMIGEIFSFAEKNLHHLAMCVRWSWLREAFLSIFTPSALVHFCWLFAKKKRKTETGFLLQGIKAENVLWGF